MFISAAAFLLFTVFATGLTARLAFGQYLPLTAGTLTGHLSGPSQIFTNPSLQSIDGIAQVDQFPGADFCVKLRAANVYALAKGISLVDATHFSGLQPCSVDPFNSLGTARSMIKLTDLLPAARITTSVPWVINNSGINIIGKGPAVTWIDYTGASNQSYVIGQIGNTSGPIELNEISELSVLGGTSTAGAVADGLYFTYTHRWKVDDVETWGMTGCGIHTKDATSPTLIRPRTSSQDAQIYGWLSRTTPTSGLCFDGISGTGGGQTTAGTVVDAAAEYVTGTGWVLTSANSMTFTSGTSEGNGGGIYINAGSNQNTFIGTDIEQNGGASGANGVDIDDNGDSNYFRNVIATSACSCSSVYLQGAWSVLEGGYQATSPGGSGLNWVQHEGNVTESALVVNGGMSVRHTTNNSGFQMVTLSGCTIRAGAIGNECATAARGNFPVDGIDSASVVVCQLRGGNGLNVIGPLTRITHTGFDVQEVAMSSTATGGGTITCLVGHN